MTKWESCWNASLLSGCVSWLTRLSNVQEIPMPSSSAVVVSSLPSFGSWLNMLAYFASTVAGLLPSTALRERYSIILTDLQHILSQFLLTWSPFWDICHPCVHLSLDLYVVRRIFKYYQYLSVQLVWSVLLNRSVQLNIFCKVSTCATHFVGVINLKGSQLA